MLLIHIGFIKQFQAEKEPNDVSTVVPDIRPFLISGNRPDLRFYSPDIRLHSPDIRLHSPDIRLHSPDIRLHSPDIRLKNLFKIKNSFGK